VYTTNQYYGNIPFICPSSKKHFKEEIPPELRLQLRNGNLMIQYQISSYMNMIGVLLSEQFFAVETMCRMILIGSCVEFALKSVNVNTVIQHKEIHLALKRMGNKNDEKLTCKLCAFRKDCKKSEDFLILAQIYELFYHLRVIKDYRQEFWDAEFFVQIFKDGNLRHMLNLVMAVEQIQNKIDSDYWTIPFSITENNDLINSLSKEIFQTDKI
jgi:hypothetical protein